MGDAREPEDAGTLVTGADGGPRLRRIRLRVADGADAGQSLSWASGTRLVGTSPETDLPLADERVSRRHLALEILDDGVRVRDLESKNGTWLNGARVERAVVGPGARLTLGHTELVLEAEDAATDDIPPAFAFGPVTTRSATFARTLGLLTRAAAGRTTVLLEGETGTGKDVLARAIHDESGRTGPFLVVDCGALARELLASELFGHRRGAFTGATDDREGVFEAARGGTVFIDELGELPADLQPALLRVLESRQVRRVGENRGRDVDVRILAATHRALDEEVAEGRFRADLFFRLAVIRVHLPPLRERPEDLAPLVAGFLEDTGRPERAFSPAQMAALESYGWPGNVRQLKNVVERSAALSAETLTFFGLPDDRPAAGARDDDAFAGQAYKDARLDAIADFEQRYVRGLLRAHDGNVSRAAREAGIARHYLHRLMRRYGIDRHEVSS